MAPETNLLNQTKSNALSNKDGALLLFICRTILWKQLKWPANRIMVIQMLSVGTNEKMILLPQYNVEHKKEVWQVKSWDENGYKFHNISNTIEL